MYQKAIIVGNLGADPELRSTSGGLQVCNLRVAVAGRKKTDETTWWRVVCFRQAAEFASTYLHKGRLVLVEGEIKQSKWNDKQGQDRVSLELIANTVKGLGRGDDQPRGEGQGPSQRPAAKERQAWRDQSDDEIPF